MKKRAKPLRKWWILLALTTAISMIFIDITVLPVALPTIQRELGIPELGLQWIVNAYTLALTIFLLAGGWLGSRFGSRRIFLCGLVLFAFGSALCGLGSTTWWFILSRAIQGVGGALLIPNGPPILFSSFPPQERGKAMGFYVSIGSLFLALGPFIGGVLSQYLSWRFIFWINLPISLIGVILTLIFVPKMERRERIFDWRGFSTFSIGISGLVIALMQAKQWGFTSPITLMLLGIGIVFLIALFRIEKKISDPYLDLSLNKNRNFLGAALSTMVVQFILMVTVYWAIYYQNVLGYLPAQAGAIQLISNAPIMIIAPIGGHLFDKHGPRLPVTCGFTLLILSLCWFTINIDSHSPWLLLSAIIPFGCGIPLVLTPSFTSALSEAAPERRSIATGTISTLRHFGGTLGLAILTSLFLTIQGGQFSNDLKRNTETLSLSPKTFRGLLSKVPEAKVALNALPEETRTYVKQSFIRAFISGFKAINILVMGVAIFGMGSFLLLVKKRTQPKL